MKTLYSEIEGLLRRAYFSWNNDKDNPKTADLVKQVSTLGQEKIGTAHSPLLLSEFVDFLNGHIYGRFDPQSNEHLTTRNTSLQSVLAIGGYTSEAALQGILIIDHLSYFM